MQRKWLVTIAPDQVPTVAAMLRHLGYAVAADAAIPVDGDSVVSVSGPDVLESQLTGVPGVKAVHPDSDLTMY